MVAWFKIIFLNSVHFRQRCIFLNVYLQYTVLLGHLKWWRGTSRSQRQEVLLFKIINLLSQIVLTQLLGWLLAKSAFRKWSYCLNVGILPLILETTTIWQIKVLVKVCERSSHLLKHSAELLLYYLILLWFRS